MDDLWHIIPVGDLKEHTDSEFCECEPKVEESDGNVFIVHNSYDGREGVEWAKEILNN
jgi:hypothetical protein